MNYAELFITALAAFLAAFTGAWVAGTLAGRVKISEFRQSWINKLRELLAELTSSALHYWAAGYEDRTDAEYKRVTLLEAHIQLMLNPNEKDHRQLEVLIRKMVQEINYVKGKTDEFPRFHTEVIATSRRILKRDWERVKQPRGLGARQRSGSA